MINRRSLGLVCAAILSATLGGGAQATGDRVPPYDSLWTGIERATAREDWSALKEAEALAGRLQAQAPNDGSVQYVRGCALFRLALIGSRRGDHSATHELLSTADHTLEASAALVPVAETHALRASVLGQLIGLSGSPFSAMGLGPRSGAEMKCAPELGPDNARVWLLRGINTMHTPKIWRGGLRRAEENLLKAQVLFAAVPPTQRCPHGEEPRSKSPSANFT
jgi:hypothetical protein